MCGQGGSFGVQNTPLFAVRVLHGVIDTHIPQVQAVLQNAVGISSVRAVGGIGRHVVVGNSVLAGDLPLCSEGRIVNLNAALEIKGRVESLIHKLLDVLFVNPGGTQAHLDFRSVQVFGLGCGQSLHVDGKGRVLLRRPLCLAQLPAHVAGEVLIGGDIVGSPVRFVLTGDTEDDPSQFSGQFFAGFSGQLLHIGHIHTCLFRDGYCQGFGGGVYGGNGLMGFDGPFCEHIRLSFQLAVLVQHLQGAEQVVAGIIGKGQPVAPVVDKAIFFREAVIEPIQLCHLRLNVGIRCTGVHFQVDELLHTVPQLHQSLDAGLGGGVQVRAHHAAVFPEVHRAVHHREGVVFYVGVSGNESVDVLALAQFRQFSLLVGSSDVFDGIMELVS